MKKARNNKPLVEVFTGVPWEAELVKGLLESDGIESLIKDGIMDTLSPYIGPEVSVMVNEEDYEAAIGIIKCKDKKTK